MANQNGSFGTGLVKIVLDDRDGIDATRELNFEGVQLMLLMRREDCHSQQSWWPLLFHMRSGVLFLSLPSLSLMFVKTLRTVLRRLLKIARSSRLSIFL